MRSLSRSMCAFERSRMARWAYIFRQYRGGLVSRKSVPRGRCGACAPAAPASDWLRCGRTRRRRRCRSACAWRRAATTMPSSPTGWAAAAGRARTKGRLWPARSGRRASSQADCWRPLDRRARGSRSARGACVGRRLPRGSRARRRLGLRDESGMRRSACDAWAGKMRGRGDERRPA
jgi:hypothetical protein